MFVGMSQRYQEAASRLDALPIKFPSEIPTNRPMVFLLIAPLITLQAAFRSGAIGRYLSYSIHLLANLYSLKFRFVGASGTSIISGFPVVATSTETISN